LYVVLRARRLIDGTGRDSVDHPVVMVKNNSISAVGVDGDEDDRLFGALKGG
jgi:hypothetical protein